MLIRTGYQISVSCDCETAFSGLLSIHPSRAGDVRSPAILTSSAPAPLVGALDEFGNLRTRTVLPAGTTTFKTDFVVADPGLPDVVPIYAPQTPVARLPDDALRYLVASRYCESDKLASLAWSLFGSCIPGYPRVQAILNYAHQRITFSYPNASSTRSAFEAHEGRSGVCRDYAHLAVALCRAMNIPARYCTGYLGDIGVPEEGEMDFSAWFEAYLGDRWYTFDARHNKPRIGRIVMARGRDAADVAIYTTYGPSRLVEFKIHTYEVNGALSSRAA